MNPYSTANSVADARRPRKMQGISRLKDSGVVVDPKRHRYGASKNSGLAQALRDLQGMRPRLKG